MYDQRAVRQHVNIFQLNGGSARNVSLPGTGKSATPMLADLLWASSSSASDSVAFNWALQNSHAFIVPNVSHSNNNTVSAPIKEKAKQDKKDVVPEGALSATFADLPGPELKWEKMSTAPVPHLDGAAIQIKNLLYVFAGYGTIDYVRILTCTLSL